MGNETRAGTMARVMAEMGTREVQAMCEEADARTQARWVAVMRARMDTGE